MNYLDSTIRRVIAERRKSGEDAGDLLSMLLNAVDSEDSKTRMTDDQARDEAVVLFLAGHDTTGAALTWFWYIMGKYQDVQQRAYQEVESVLQNNAPEYSDVLRLPFLSSTIKETLRLFPPAIGVFAREAKEPMELGGYPIPKGSMVYAFSYVTHRDGFRSRNSLIRNASWAKTKRTSAHLRTFLSEQAREFASAHTSQ